MQLCTTCANDSAKQIVSNSHDNTEIKNELSNILHNSERKGPNNFDALVLFSGGKDSCFLVHQLREKHPDLRIILLTIDNTFMSPIALSNIEATVRKFDLNLMTIRPPESLYNKMFSHALKNVGDKGCSAYVDQFDGDFFHDIGRNIAAQMKIPLLISGCSKTQVERILKLRQFESPKHIETKNRTEVSGLNLKSIFNDEELKWWWNPERYNLQDLPRVLYPFYAWDLDETYIKDFVVKNGYLKRGSENPLLTNNQLVPLMAMVDMANMGYSSFEPEFCQMIRQGKADKKLWKNIFELSEYAAKTGQFVSGSVNDVLKRLKLSKKQLGIK